jgi:S1-C subfamily serine protease
MWSALLLVLATAPVTPPPNESRTPLKLTSTTPLTPRRINAPYCASEYSNDFAALNKAALDLNAKPVSQFTYCVRVTATYECLSYAADGSVKRAKKNVTAHGTAFAYRKQAGDTLLATNFHVTEFPPVSDEEHPVDGVPQGCKRVTDSLKIVDSEKDAYETDDISLGRVVADPALDIAILRSKAALNVLPWRVGKSAALKERNVVDVRGFPLGAFKATSLGKVISTYDRDDFKDWDHDDFVIDAAMSPGNSGSPVLAVSCTTGEYELVGIFHADYTRGNSLNVVIHIDDVRDLMTTLKRSTATRSDSAQLDLSARRRLLDDASDGNGIFFPFGALTASAQTRSDGSLLFQVFSREFPLDTWPVLTLEDAPPSEAGEFGALGKVWFGSARGVREFLRSELDAENRAQLERALDALRRSALLSAAHRRATAGQDASREAHDLASRLDRNLRRNSGLDKDLAGVVMDLAEKEAPRGNQLALPPSRPWSSEATPAPP